MTDQFTIGVFSIIFDTQKRVLLAHRRDMDLWDLPGGGMNHGELPTETAIREAKEETGFDIAIDRLLSVYAKPAPLDKDLGFIFLAHVIGGEMTLSSESDDVVFFSSDEFPENINPRLRAVVDNALQNISETLFIKVNLLHTREWFESNMKTSE